MNKLIAQIKSLSGLITAVVVIVSTTLAVTRSANKRGEAQSANFERVFDSIAEVKDMVSYDNEKIIQVSGDVQSMQGTLKNFEGEHKRQGEQINTIVWGLKNLDRFTPDDFEDIIDEMLKKQYVDSINAVMRSYKGEVVFEIVE